MDGRPGDKSPGDYRASLRDGTSPQLACSAYKSNRPSKRLQSAKIPPALGLVRFRAKLNTFDFPAVDANGCAGQPLGPWGDQKGH
jgi:hypothetical protein